MSGKIIIVGPGGSGKDFLRKKMVNRGFEYGVSFTSRPPREGEEEGVDYYYRDEDFFISNLDIFLIYCLIHIIPIHLYCLRNFLFAKLNYLLN